MVAAGDVRAGKTLRTSGFPSGHHPHPGNKEQIGKRSLSAREIFEAMRCCDKRTALPWQSAEVIFSTGLHFQAEFSNVVSYTVLARHLLTHCRK